MDQRGDQPACPVCESYVTRASLCNLSHALRSAVTSVIRTYSLQALLFCYCCCAEEHCVISPCWKKKNDVAKMRQAGTAPATSTTIHCPTSLWCAVMCEPCSVMDATNTIKERLYRERRGINELVATPDGWQADMRLEFEDAIPTDKEAEKPNQVSPTLSTFWTLFVGYLPIH